MRTSSPGVKVITDIQSAFPVAAVVILLAVGDVLFATLTEMQRVACPQRVLCVINRLFHNPNILPIHLAANNVAALPLEIGASNCAASFFAVSSATRMVSFRRAVVLARFVAAISMLLSIAGIC